MSHRHLIRVGGKEGYIDAKARVVIKPQYDGGGNFHEGRAIVFNTEPGKLVDPLLGMYRRTVGVIDEAGREVVPLTYPDIDEYSEGLAAFRGKKKWGYLDRDGNIAFEPRFDRAWKFSEGLATVLNGKVYSVIDQKGVVQFESPVIVGDCREGLMHREFKRKWSYLDRKGAVAFELTCSAAGPFREGLAGVLSKSWMGYIDHSGRFVIEPRFGQAANFSEGLASVDYVDDIKAKDRFAEPQKFGFIDRTGEMVIPGPFSYAESFSEGLAAVNPARAAHSTGYINKAGEMVIKPMRCELAGPFTGGLAYIQYASGKLGYINTEGEFVWDPQS